MISYDFLMISYDFPFDADNFLETGEHLMSKIGRQMICPNSKLVGDVTQ